MSSILKALKRLENEKAARKPDSFKIDAEILKSGSSRKISVMTAFIAATAIFACGGSVAYLVMKQHYGTPPPVHTPQAPAPVKPATASDPSATGNVTPVAPATIDKTVEIPVFLTKPAPPAIERSVPPLLPAVKRPQPQLEGPAAQTAPQAAPAEPGSAISPATPPAKAVVFKVDGIAYQDGGSDSLAVVNGTTVTKGSVLEGARVEEIQRDRVKFSRGGEKFEVILDKSN